MYAAVALVPDTVMQRIEEGEIVSSTQVDELVDDKRRLSVTSVGLVKQNKKKILALFDHPKALQSLSKQIQKVESLYSKKQNKIFLIQACFFLCAFKIKTAVDLHIGPQQKDQHVIAWQFLGSDVLAKKTSHTKWEKYDLHFVGMKGSTILKDYENDQTLVGLESSWNTESSAFFRWMQKWMLKKALNQTIYEIRSNLESNL